MNKNRLLALVVVALPAGAFASDVEIYGKLTGAIQSTRTTLAWQDQGTTTNIDSHDSYIGFKGNEDLGNGLKAIWQVEQAIAIDGSNSQNGWATREAFVGLSGAWGTVQAGYLDNFQRKYSRLDPHKATGWTGMRNVNVNNARSAASTESLVKNALAYTSPEWNGLTGRVLYSAAGEGRSINDNTENLYEIGLRYVRDGFYGQYAYTRAHNGGTNGSSYPVGPGLADSPAHIRVHYLEAGYEANGWLAAVTYMNRHGTQDAYIHPGSGLQESTSTKSRAIGVNLAYTLGRWTPHFQYQHGWQPSDFFYGSYLNTSGQSWNQYIFGVDYALSKRTELQAAAGYMKSGNDPLRNKPKVKGHTISLGLSHSF
ncbi:porin [Laribacter hongkongensis]|uniref:porin n=1 Tax=Laribacter hongkongensis TaxID=168471 RepID=UPI001EFD5B9A|nr:porin [Laribacter hongkongensis]MCG9080580.1 porin [Laribacter hongkongensis]